MSLLVAVSVTVGGAWIVGVSAWQPDAAADVTVADRAPDTLRLMTWNVDDDDIIPEGDPEWTTDGRAARFARVVRAVRPDVLCLQEVTRPASVVVKLVTRLLPVPDDDKWHGHAFDSNVIVSRFPLKARAGRSVRLGLYQRGHATARIDLPDRAFPHDLYLICAHLQSGGGPDQVRLRQQGADVIAAWIRDARTPGGRITLKDRTPIVVAGDLNVIDDPSPSLRTLMTGAVADDRNPVRVAPDWDGTDLRDALPRQNDTDPATYTWRDDTQLFPPGTLDRILYTASDASISRSFVLNTTRMSAEQLARNGLRANDVMRDPVKGIHDHLPLVADFLISE